MRSKRLLSFHIVIGTILVIFAIIGYITIADDIRHTGELMGATCVLLAGLVLLLVNSKIKFLKNLALHWISICLIVCIPIGAYLFHNMILAMLLAIILGIGLAYKLGKRKLSDCDKTLN